MAIHTRLADPRRRLQGESLRRLIRTLKFAQKKTRPFERAFLYANCASLRAARTFARRARSSPSFARYSLRKSTCA